MGCTIPGTVAAHENLAFCYAGEGFHMIRGGTEVVPIGDEKVNHWFRARLNASYSYRTSSVVDPINHLYMVSFPSGASADGTPDTIMVYDWGLGRWSYAEVDLELICSAILQASYTIDTMDDVSATIDGLIHSVDSSFWSGSGAPVLSGFDTSHRQGYFAGDTLEATIETADEQPTPGRKTLIRRVRPMIEGQNVTPSVSIGYRDDLSNSIMYTNPVAKNSTGICPVRANGRYLRAKVTIPAGSQWDFARGIEDLKFSPMGRR
jgi:hypothetical protein